MRAIVTADPINEDDRTVDMTVAIYNDQNTLLQTESILVPIDGITNAEVNARLLDLMEQVKKQRAALPYTQAQIDAAFLGQTAILPD